METSRDKYGHEAFLEACYHGNARDVKSMLSVLKQHMTAEELRDFVNRDGGRAVERTLKGEFKTWTGEDSVGAVEVIRCLLQAGADLSRRSIKGEKQGACKAQSLNAFLPCLKQ